MTDQKKTTEDSAVELDESELDQAKGGFSYSLYDYQKMSSNFAKLEDFSEVQTYDPELLKITI